jgi:hypothetical protein
MEFHLLLAELMDEVTEGISALFVAGELVEGGSAGRKQNSGTARCELAGGRDGVG